MSDVVSAEAVGNPMHADVAYVEPEKKEDPKEDLIDLSDFPRAVQDTLRVFDVSGDGQISGHELAVSKQLETRMLILVIRVSRRRHPCR